VKRVFILLALLGLSHPLWSANNETQKVITELEFKWAEAQRLGNAKVVAPMLAEGFVNTDADGQTYGREKLLSNLKGGQWEQNGISDVKVTVYGSTAIATGAWAGKGIDGDGTRVDRAERWTDTWEKMPGGKWQCVASQQTSTPKR
jgi:ketosteroid isomerase-like protein